MPKGQVLIVDDYQTSLEGMAAALERDFRVLLAADSKTADSLLSQGPVDLVVLDVVLRQESGLDFLGLLRRKSDVPVLLISGYGTKEMIIAGMRSRANDYLDKPFTITQLREKVRELICAGPAPSHIADRIRDFIQQQYMQDWTVDQLAKALDLSVRTMRHVFLRKFGRQPSDYLEEVRLANARVLLATTDSSIRAVATQVGFRDPHYFARVFRQHVGKCPRVFRTEQRHDLNAHT
ncbi:MAG TPA: response regulator [Candidatus Methylomirabilis sp.]|nr:response regulator [Candidatus Methylomirabilis sp.]